jgi:DNA (cytosine-5)-methyltransferase 1
MLKLLSLFSGIGAFEKALDNLEVPYELVNFCEFDKYAVKSYCAIHGVDESKNLGDITKVDETKLPKDLDVLTYGFPCQDISIAGNQKGLFNRDGTLTRSGLFFDALRIIETTKPKIAIAENVKNLVGKKFNAQFQVVLASLESAGYNNYWKVLNAKDFGVPQNRERVFIVSIRKDIDTGKFEFPEPFPLEKRLKDVLEEVVDEKYYLSPEAVAKIKRHKNKIIENDTPDTSSTIHAGYYKKGGRDQQYVKSKKILVWDGFNQSIRKDSSVVGTLTQNCGADLKRNGQGIIESTDDVECIRNLTPKECFRLMGFDDESFHKAEVVNSNTQLYKQAGNSIVVDVLEELFCMMLDEDGHLYV